MKKTEVEKFLVSGEEVAVVRSESWGASYGFVSAMHAPRRVYHGSRDFRGSVVNDGVEVTFPNGRKETFPLNQIKDAKETRAMEQARFDRRQSQDQMIEGQKSAATYAVQQINAKLEAEGVVGRASVAATHAYGDFRITGWHVDLPASVAVTLASVLS